VLYDHSDKNNVKRREGRGEGDWAGSLALQSAKTTSSKVGLPSAVEGRGPLRRKKEGDPSMV